MALERRSLISVALLLVSVTLIAAGQLLMRRGMLEFGQIDSFAAFVNLVWSGLAAPSTIAYVWAGMIVYAAAVMVWLQVLSRMALSLAFPMMSLSYIAVYIGAAFWPALDEPIGPYRLAGTGLIMLGVALVAQSRQG
ncbi:hypothetical protein [Salinisphaera sp. T31B1]|uniref:hypothetical protein n=1 Tax=Salinisphaera sp. T31B1 TaxID=727963 RepID=UPI00333FAA08